VLTLAVTSKNLVLKKRDVVSDFDIEGIFHEIANRNFERALQSAQGFREEAPRATASIAICQSALNEKTGSPLTSPTNLQDTKTQVMKATSLWGAKNSILAKLEMRLLR
jgi:hypothetical protein